MHERAFFETKTVAHLKMTAKCPMDLDPFMNGEMTAKCPMDLDFQKLNSAYSRGHFNTDFTHRAQIYQNLKHVEIWSQMHASKNRKFSSVLRFNLNGTYRHENFIINQAIHEDQENP